MYNIWLYNDIEYKNDDDKKNLSSDDNIEVINIVNKIECKYNYDKKFLNSELMINTTYDPNVLSEKEEKEVSKIEVSKIEKIGCDNKENSNYIIRVKGDRKGIIFNNDGSIADNNIVVEDDDIVEEKLADEKNPVVEDDTVSVDLIDNIYDHCYKSAFMYSWDYFACNMFLKPYSLLLYSSEENYNKVKQKLHELELLIKEQCIIVSLYTVQYILNKEHTISADTLSSINFKGFDYYKEHPNESYKDESLYNKINSVLKKVEESRENEKIDSFLGEVLDMMLDDMFPDTSNNMYREGNKRLIPLFLCDFLLKAIYNYDKLDLDKSLNTIKNSKVSNINRKKEAFIKNYINYMNDFICHPTESNWVDKILFYYQKDQVFNCGLIYSCFVGENSESPLIKSTNIELVKECMILQNISFKTEIVKLFDEFEDIQKYFIKEPKEILEVLSSVIIPTFERTFFITLYEYFIENSKSDTKDTLKKIDKELKSYFNKYALPITDRIFNNKSIDFKMDFKKNEKKSEINKFERMRILREILECFFNERKENIKMYGRDDIYYNSVKKYLFQFADNLINKGL